MNRTQHLTASQPRPKRRVARPGACSLHVVANPAKAANDHHIGSREELPRDPVGRAITMSPGEARGTDDQLNRAIEAELDALNRYAAVITVGQVPRLIVTDNGKEFHSSDMDWLSAALIRKSAEPASTPTRSAE